MPSKKIVKTDTKAKSKTEALLETALYNHEGKASGKISLPKEVFDREAKPELLNMAVRIYLANQRSGTHKAKTRGMVTGSTRKLFRQKGTGRARHGDIKAPIFIGGGVAHGPLPRDYRLAFPKKMKRLALYGALTAKYRENSLKVVAKMEELQPKTRDLFRVLKNLDLEPDKKNEKMTTLLITDGKADNLVKAGRNLANVKVSPVNQLSAYEVLVNRKLVMTQKAVKMLTSDDEAPAKTEAKKTVKKSPKKISKS
ncbi:MAG: 50S ribosomal protein L4P, large subunit ribosomal protein L4 [Candidatus Gottesmanbacteria bacterium GW2011_GWA2_43_14]|uniref:Large ribosomal subunit protein uL4 n=1 Tax=Candidatus Gottesmanbacteria bacterium GW2011_GWA2_43_14 TaxID=1618443 RepID=A0A0G1DEG7_9BACT|nr:MAG: 50S ribosomal protein L4P, large subunit ribosomal protein L4 [Candidatus Gottesmanbacteria bacterium GW2011_GWA2_43_14]